jgi:hypothetical protein
MRCLNQSALLEMVFELHYIKYEVVNVYSLYMQ